MPVFAIVVLILTFIVLVAMFTVRSRKAEANPRRRSRPRADDSPRMPLGDLPVGPSRHRR